MKLCLKQGESLRIAHDADASTFRIYILEGALHITANAPGESTEITIDDAVKMPAGPLESERAA
ncbi:MAG: hypothetical protein EPO27_10470 [Betaproteobacteria bacterium]|nr:MAG: hypothetical protein EPO27_10470 [Betaproteobacteria bacterium]